MPRELPAYRDNLQDILEFTNGRRILTVRDVKAYTGIADTRTAKKRYPFDKNLTISAPTLARCMAGGETR